MNLVNLKDAKRKRFSEFASEPKILDGAKVRLDDILNQEIEVIGYRVTDSKFEKNKSGKCLTIQFVDAAGGRKVVFTGSDVLLQQIEKYAVEIPFYVTIKRVDRYYLFT